jgi:hypothetical protein
LAKPFLRVRTGRVHVALECRDQRPRDSMWPNPNSSAVDPHPGQVLMDGGADVGGIPCLLQGLLGEPLDAGQVGQLMEAR